MQFNMMQSKYPGILHPFREVAALIRAGASSKMAVRYMHPWVNVHILEADREAVTGKLRQWAEVVEDNNRHTYTQPPREPAPCPVCGSVDAAGGRCWCRK